MKNLPLAMSDYRIWDAVFYYYRSIFISLLYELPAAITFHGVFLQEEFIGS